MAELATMCHVIRAEQDVDITVKLWLLALYGTTRPAGFPMLGQVPPQLLIHAFFGIDVAIDRFLTDAQFRALKDHTIADLLGRPALLDTRDHSLAQIWVPD